MGKLLVGLSILAMAAFAGCGAKAIKSDRAYVSDDVKVTSINTAAPGDSLEEIAGLPGLYPKGYTFNPRIGRMYGVHFENGNCVGYIKNDKGEIEKVPIPLPLPEGCNIPGYHAETIDVCVSQFRFAEPNQLLRTMVFLKKPADQCQCDSLDIYRGENPYTLDWPVGETRKLVFHQFPRGGKIPKGLFAPYNASCVERMPVNAQFSGTISQEALYNEKSGCVIILFNDATIEQAPSTWGQIHSHYR